MNRIKYVLPVLLIGNLLCMMDVSIMTIILPEIQTAFHESLSNLSWTLNVYTIVFASLIIPFGRLAEKVGRNKFVMCGLIIFGMGSLVTGLSNGLIAMLIARGIQSIGAAMIIPTSMVIGLEISNQQNRNKIVAALAGIQGLAVALGPSVGGFVAQYWGWRWVFFVNVPLVILDLLVFPLVLPLRHERTQTAKIDWFGAVLSIVMLFTLSLGLIKGNAWKWHSLPILSLLGISAVAFIGFVIFERKIKAPMINMRLFKSRNFDGASICLVLCNFFLGGMAVLIPTFLTRVHGESELHAALLITPYSVAVMFSVIFTSLLIKKINNQFLIGLGFTLIGISYYLLANMDVSRNYHQLIVAAITLGVGYGLVAATANILAVADFHGSILTASQSVANVLRQVGMVIAIAVFMSILSTNMVTAKQHTRHYGVRQTASLMVPTTVKHRINDKLAEKLNPKNNTVTKVKNRLTVDASRDFQKAKDNLIQRAYDRQLTMIAHQKAISTSHIPESLKVMLRKKVAFRVGKMLTTRATKIQHQVMLLMNGIKNNLKKHLNQAFLSVYGSLFWLPFASMLVVPLFKFKKRRVVK